MVLTSFAFLLHRNWSARIGELHAVHGLELYCWWSVSKMMLLSMQLCVQWETAGEGCRAAIAGFVDMTPHSEFYASLTKPECKQPGACCCCSWSLLSSSQVQTSFILPAG